MEPDGLYKIMHVVVDGTDQGTVIWACGSHTALACNGCTARRHDWACNFCTAILTCTRGLVRPLYLEVHGRRKRVSIKRNGRRAGATNGAALASGRGIS